MPAWKRNAVLKEMGDVKTVVISGGQRGVRVRAPAAGNYDSYLRTRAELEDAQTKKHKWEQDQISHMKEYIARFGHGSAKLARQAQSKEKTLEKMVRMRINLVARVLSDHA